MTQSPADLMQWCLAIFLAALEATIIAMMWLGTRRSSTTSRWTGINLEKLIGEQDGSASFSRFQFLIFTFIVASAYVVQAFIRVKANADLPTIPESVLGLIGISGGSYLVSKGIETGANSTAGGAGTSTPDGRWVR